ncbi:PREDICTED: uncharacterized protein LOC105596826 isoform X2 [Cercocebus atys]|uniref:uncharacterized protein LOC105596826 isoform X2 n=1 Tax=Cercocebus atys TaxID=9531 RepID=UPI0005F53F04|nr:PREDICTED: uncharacterized protein LOC105596826 isoform X2 [Cercocebus atys]XP_011939645.1 PREDICTED: uncharacterized protein LOC105596826 isoform X2 [Cercocebus atys]
MGEEWGRPAGCGASAGGLDDWLQLAGRHVRGGLPSPLLPPPPPFVQRRALRGALVAPARCAPCHRPAVPVSPLGGQGFVRDAVDGYWAERGTHGSIKMWGGWGEQGRVPVWTPLAPGSQGVEGNVSTALQSQQLSATSSPAKVKTRRHNILRRDSLDFSVGDPLFPYRRNDHQSQYLPLSWLKGGWIPD